MAAGILSGRPDKSLLPTHTPGGEKFGESHCLAKNPKMIQAGLELRSFQHPPMRPFHNGNWTEWRALGSDIIVTFSKSSRRESLISEKNGITRDLFTLLYFIHFESAKLITQIQY